MIGTNARRVKKIKALAERVGFESTHEGLADFFNFAIPLARLAFTPALLPDSTSYLGPIVPKLFPIRWKVLHFNATEHPTNPWIVQQLREAFPDDTAPTRDPGTSFASGS